MIRSIVPCLFPLCLLTAFSVQASPNLKHCSEATSALTRFAQANKAMAEEQRNKQQLSGAKFAQKTQALDDLVATYTMSKCMKGEHQKVFQCLRSSTLDLSLCRQ